jgi:hypothetical protein
MNRVRVYVSFDRENDRDLCDRLAAESRRPDSRFEIAGCSPTSAHAHARSEIDDADEMIVVCGSQSDASVQMHAELLRAQELGKPYFLLWGRREAMCKRPLGARPDDAMYGWSPNIIHNQVVVTLRDSRPLEVPEHCKKALARPGVAR